MRKNILITGGCGFIGSHLVRHFVNKYPDYLIVNMDALTYAGVIPNLGDIWARENYAFEYGDINKLDDVVRIIRKHGITDIIHLAAESHVDRSITNPNIFIETNVGGTVNLLRAAMQYWEGDLDNHRFHHVSTDEVYGSLGLSGTDKFTESTPYSPHSPYSASKAASDHMVRAYHDTYGMNVTISNCSNNYGPNQFPEKLIPLMVTNLIDEKPLPVYGDGANVRDWLYVTDHCEAIDLVFHHGRCGESYNIGGGCEVSNIDMVNRIIDVYCEITGKDGDRMRVLISHIDNPRGGGHDLRYAIDYSKIQNELGWSPITSIEQGLMETVKWYVGNPEWIEHIRSGKYKVVNAAMSACEKSFFKEITPYKD